MGVDRTVQCETAVGVHDLTGNPRQLQYAQRRLRDVVGLPEAS